MTTRREEEGVWIVNSGKQCITFQTLLIPSIFCVACLASVSHFGDDVSDAVRVDWEFTAANPFNEVRREPSRTANEAFNIAIVFFVTRDQQIEQFVFLWVFCSAAYQVGKTGLQHCGSDVIIVCDPLFDLLKRLFVDLFQVIDVLFKVFPPVPSTLSEYYDPFA
eukprot:TRINITY_DN66060_c0_g1_i2.p2 TRINITY_DN66060_c0_g1~~TRINITY_DN66060_c0_g1_i2.p2  ORF type:complete len:164 (-),score=4.58 TRINITY_DN66060_c0_g1_i2:120-611(-)